MDGSFFKEEKYVMIFKRNYSEYRLYFEGFNILIYAFIVLFDFYLVFCDWRVGNEGFRLIDEVIEY